MHSHLRVDVCCWVFVFCLLYLRVKCVKSVKCFMETVTYFMDIIVVVYLYVWIYKNVAEKIKILCKYLDSLVGANRSSSSSSKRLLLWDILALGRLEGALALDFIPPVLLFGLIHWSCHSNIQERKCIILYVPWNVGMQQGNITFCILVPHRRWRVSWSKSYWVAAWML